MLFQWHAEYAKYFKIVMCKIMWIVGERQELFASVFLGVSTNHFSPVCVAALCNQVSGGTAEPLWVRQAAVSFWGLQPLN